MIQLKPVQNFQVPQKPLIKKRSSQPDHYILKNKLECDCVSFTSTRKSQSKDGITVNCNYTNIFRGDIDWEKLAKFLDNRFKQNDAVKIHCYASSDGSEPYSLAWKLIDTLGPEKASRFFPILAKDIDPEIISQAQSGILYLSDRDIDVMKHQLKKVNISQIIKPHAELQTKIEKGIEFKPYIINSPYKDCVKFSVANILTDIESNKLEDSAVIFRNAWTFMDLEQQKSLSSKLFSKMNQKSFLLIGNSDLFKSNAYEYIIDTGFNGIHNGVFLNSEKDYPGTTIGLPKEKKSSIPDCILFEK